MIIFKGQDPTTQQVCENKHFGSAIYFLEKFLFDKKKASGKKDLMFVFKVVAVMVPICVKTRYIAGLESCYHSHVLRLLPAGRISPVGVSGAVSCQREELAV